MDVGRFSQEPSGLIIFVILAAASPIGNTANKIWNKLQQKKAHGKEQVRAQCGLRSAGSPAIIPLEQQAQHQHSFEKDSVSQSSRSTFNHVQEEEEECCLSTEEAVVAEATRSINDPQNGSNPADFISIFWQNQRQMELHSDVERSSERQQSSRFHQHLLP